MPMWLRKLWYVPVMGIVEALKALSSRLLRN
jgi:hypothetical protein